MTKSERVRAIRKANKLSQAAFGAEIGVSQDVITNIELNRVPLKPLTEKLICKTFNVNPLWLENEEGEMFLGISETLFEDIANQFDLSPTEIKIVSNYLKMTPDDRRKVIDLINKLIK